MDRRKLSRSLAAVAAIALAMSLCLFGCGGSSGYDSAAASSSAAAMETQSAMPAAPPQTEAANGAGIAYDSAALMEEGETAPAVPDERKIIRHASMDLETREFDEAVRQIEELVAEAGGYIESSSQEGYSLEYQGNYRERYASIQARVPSAELDGVMASVGGLCNVLSQSESMDDITDSYYDSQARLDSLEIQEERLLELLAQATSLEDMITLESALSDVRYQIESLTASLRRMDSQVAYSYLNISLQEVVEYQTIQEKPQSFGEQLSAAFGRGIEDMVDGLQDFALFLAEAGPSLVVLAAVIAAVVLVVRACVRASRKRREAKGLPPRTRPASGFTTNPGNTAPFRRQPQEPQRPQPPAPPAEPGKGSPRNETGKDEEK